MDEQLLKYFSGELNVTERHQLIRRVENDKQLKAEFIRMQNMMAVSSLSPYPADRHEGIKDYATFSSRIKRNSQRQLFTRIVQYAALAIILITSSVWATLYLSEQRTDTMMNTLYVPAGQRAQITLQDGTEVWLNAQSTLRYPSHFSKKKRSIEMTGEAFFDVAKDEKRPFIVSTHQIDFQVLGTEFNVYSYPEADYVQADLVEGSLRIVEKANQNNTVLLSSNEQMIFRENKMIVSSISNPSPMLWREGIYSFDNEPLASILQKLQLYYDVKIIVENPKIFNVRYTGKFRQRDGIDEILRIIQKIQPFEIKKDKDNNIIKLI